MYELTADKTIQEIHENRIQREAKRIKERLASGTIFGVPIDIEDIDSAIVAAYYMSKDEDIKDGINL